MVSLQVGPNSDVILGCLDGTIWHYDSKRQVTPLNQNVQCEGKHGGIVKVHYCHESGLLVLAYENGSVHISKCTLGLQSHLAWRESCSSLSDATQEIYDVECVLLSNSELECPVLEVWFGVNSDRIEVWRMPVSPNQVWAFDTVSRIRTISQVMVSGSSVERPNGAVKHVRKSLDGSMMVAVLQTAEIVIINVASHQCMQTFKFQHSGTYVYDIGSP